MNKRQIMIVGAGKIGSMIAALLAESGDYGVAIADRDPAQLDRIDGRSGISKALVDVGAGTSALAELLRGKFAVLSAAPYHLTIGVAEAARSAGVHYLDLTEDVASTREIKRLASDAGTAFIPQCGLAPGFVSIVAHALAQRFDSLDSVRLRVGALPRFPSNGLNYNLTWSTDGIINEYCEPCEAIVGGALRDVLPLEECEEFSLDGVTYEAFNTSGGLGSLCETYLGRVRELNYRTVRYAGHAAIMKVLLHDLRLCDRRHILKDILEHAVPTTLQDVAIILVTVSGRRGGDFVQDTYANKIRGREIGGQPRSAIQLTTASGICAVLDLLASGALPTRGFVRQEDVALKTFLQNRFGKIYSIEENADANAHADPHADR